MVFHSPLCSLQHRGNWPEYLNTLSVLWPLHTKCCSLTIFFHNEKLESYSLFWPTKWSFHYERPCYCYQATGFPWVFPFHNRILYYAANALSRKSVCTFEPSESVFICGHISFTLYPFTVLKLNLGFFWECAKRCDWVTQNTMIRKKLGIKKMTAS